MYLPILEIFYYINVAVIWGQSFRGRDITGEIGQLWTGQGSGHRCVSGECKKVHTSLKGRRKAVLRGRADNVLEIDTSRILVEALSEESVRPLEQVSQYWPDLTTLLKKSHSVEAGNQKTRA